MALPKLLLLKVISRGQLCKPRQFWPYNNVSQLRRLASMQMTLCTAKNAGGNQQKNIPTSTKPNLNYNKQRRKHPAKTLNDNNKDIK